MQTKIQKKQNKTKQNKNKNKKQTKTNKQKQTKTNKKKQKQETKTKQDKKKHNCFHLEKKKILEPIVLQSKADGVLLFKSIFFSKKTQHFDGK